jgi:hypothetical protein
VLEFSTRTPSQGLGISDSVAPDSLSTESRSSRQPGPGVPVGTGQGYRDYR